MKYYDTKIGKIIEEDFDVRMENAIFAYIFENGTEKLKEVTESDISKIKGEAMMTKEFCQSFVRCAVRIAKECTFAEIIEYIRLYLFCKPAVNELTLSREDFNEEAFNGILESLNLDNEEVGDSLTVYAVVNEENINS